MGLSCSSCCSSNDEDIYEDAETSDKTNLLGNPVGETSKSTRHSSGNIGDQEKLNQILQKTANSYIDVPALNSPVDQAPDKSKTYESKILSALKKRQHSEKPSLLKDTPHLEKTLGEDPLAEAEVKMVREVSSQLLAALEGIKIENTENLIIPFAGLEKSNQESQSN